VSQVSWWTTLKLLYLLAHGMHDFSKIYVYTKSYINLLLGENLRIYTHYKVLFWLVIHH